jgi:hypothetical protein
LATPLDVFLTTELGGPVPSEGVPHVDAEGVEMLIGERPQGTFSHQLFRGDTLDTDRVEAGAGTGHERKRLVAS